MLERHKQGETFIADFATDLHFSTTCTYVYACVHNIFYFVSYYVPTRIYLYIRVCVFDEEISPKGRANIRAEI